MTDLLQRAFDEAAALSSEEQNRLARWLMAELREEHGWEDRFSNSQPLLERMAADALAEHQAVDSEPLDLDT